ncbi:MULTISPECIES: SMP-30/gluconolactonase/LRE family protein [unclassified Mesorhizobium]|uniref:SMP-30/gluconolactonase/LRE family protein n=1 Tax=unclassified Mesorhizobium TaxID=325217 RepID=UPI0016733C4C|nr:MULTISPECIES: SMP-30/gluconolactonase/LRE family protein [unclassified Mesorhizobium]
MQTGLNCIAIVHNTLGECPVWDVEQQVLYWVDITERILHRYDPARDHVKTWKTPFEFGSIALRKDGHSIIAGTRDGFAIFDLDSGEYEHFAHLEQQLPENRMNDGKCDPMGRFWCGSIHEVSDPSRRLPVASVYRVDADRTVTRVRSGIKTSNGFAWSADGRTMYFTDTPTLNILAFDYDLQSGSIANERVFASVPRGHGRPDGATVDIEGCLWSAHFAGSRVTRYSPSGEVLLTLDIPAQNVTSCTFGGANMSTLFITTAREDMTEEDLRRQPLSGNVFAYDAGVAGVPMTRYAG